MHYTDITLLLSCIQSIQPKSSNYNLHVLKTISADKSLVIGQARSKERDTKYKSLEPLPDSSNQEEKDALLKVKAPDFKSGCKNSPFSRFISLILIQ